jgi:hypothetical protein
LSRKGIYKEGFRGNFIPLTRFGKTHCVLRIWQILYTHSQEKGGIFIGRRGQLIEPRKNFTIRLSDEERAQAEYDAKTNGMKLSDYVRYLILHGGKVDTTLAYDRRELISQLSGLCNNYNQMTRVANGCGYVFDSTMKTGNQLILQIKDLVQEVVCGWQ